MIFAPALHHLQKLYLGAYAHTTTTTVGPYEPDYEVGREFYGGYHLEHTIL